MSEEEKRLHRCCFSGHRPEKLNESEKAIKAWLERQIDMISCLSYLDFTTKL